MSKMLIALYVLSTSSALVVLKLGAKSGAPVQFLEGKLHFNLTPYALIGIVLYGVSFLLYMYLISKYDLGYIIPLGTGMVYILVFSASFFLFNEAFTLLKLLALILITFGLVLLNLKST